MTRVYRNIDLFAKNTHSNYKFYCVEPNLGSCCCYWLRKMEMSKVERKLNEKNCYTQLHVTDDSSSAEQRHLGKVEGNAIRTLSTSRNCLLFIKLDSMKLIICCDSFKWLINRWIILANWHTHHIRICLFRWNHKAVLGLRKSFVDLKYIQFYQKNNHSKMFVWLESSWKSIFRWPMQ